MNLFENCMSSVQDYDQQKANFKTTLKNSQSHTLLGKKQRIFPPLNHQDQLEPKRLQEIYFQRQNILSLSCGIHAINNLLGERKITKEHMDQICGNLSNKFINPHKSIFGGDYDANIMLIALDQYHMQTQWMDSRKNIQFVDNEGVVGFILNKKQEKSFTFSFFDVSGRHWWAIRRIDNYFYELDSLSKEVRRIDNIEKYLNKARKMSIEIIKVVRIPSKKTSIFSSESNQQEKKGESIK